MTSHFGLLIFLILTATSPPTRPTVFTYLNWWDMPEFAHRSCIYFIHWLRRLSTRLLHQGFKSTLLRKSLAKFFKRHGAIIEKNSITLREMRLTIQDWETRRVLCYLSSCRPIWLPYSTWCTRARHFPLVLRELCLFSWRVCLVRYLTYFTLFSLLICLVSNCAHTVGGSS